MATWRERARAHIAQTIVQARQDGLSGPQLAQRVSRAYPWPPRRNWPYRAWCLARMDVFAEEGLLDLLPRRRRGSRTTYPPQLRSRLERAEAIHRGQQTLPL